MKETNEAQSCMDHDLQGKKEEKWNFQIYGKQFPNDKDDFPFIINITYITFGSGFSRHTSLICGFCSIENVDVSQKVEDGQGHLLRTYEVY